MANGHGGKREGSGRKPKAEEQNLIEKLGPYEAKALKALIDAVEDGKSWAVTLYMAYMYGKPKETVNNNVNFDGFSIKDALRFKK